MHMVDIIEVLIEEEIPYELDHLYPTYTVHLLDVNGNTRDCIIDKITDGTDSWDIVTPIHPNPVSCSAQDELRSWIKNYLKE